MKLYMRCRVFCAIWCSAEILLFGGIIYGWGSLVFVLKQEGFYSEECINSTIDLHVNGIISKLDTNLTSQALTGVNSTDQRSVDIGNYFTSISQNTENVQSCPQQESKLNLWFSLAVAFMYLSMAFLGELTTRLGTQITRHIFTFTFVVGSLCVAFASKELPWLLCPGLCGIAVSGLVIFATNIQVSNLFPRLQSTVVALYCGLFDSSSVIQQLMKIAKESGISHRTFYLCLAGLAFLMLNTSTIFFLPKSYITKQKIRRKSCEIEAKTGFSNFKGLTFETDETSVRSCILSPTYIIHVAWMSINTVTFVTFIGLINVNLEQLSRNNNVVSTYLGVFAYTTMCTVVAGLLAGMSYDCQRKRYCADPVPSRVWMPVLLPLTMTGILGSMVYVLLLVEHLSVMVPIFISFTLYRSFLYSIGVAFVNDAFPEQHFGTLYGIMTFSTGLFSMFQYGFFSWFDAYENAPLHVKLCLLFLCLVTFVHPVQLYIRSTPKCVSFKTDDTDSQELESLKDRELDKMRNS